MLSHTQISTPDIDLCKSDNRILNVGGSGSDNYSRIQYALNIANDGDTVFVWDDSSPYFETLVIEKRVLLQGENKTTTIIDGMGNDDVITITINGVTVSGFTIQNSKKDWINAGITLFSDQNHVYDNIIFNAENGIYSYDLDETIIENNQISECNNCGVNIPFSTYNTIKDNTFQNCDQFGIFIYDSLYDTVTNNNITNSAVGIHLWYSFYNTLSYNSVTNSAIGLRFCLYSKNNTITHNVIKNSRDRGIELNYSLWNNLNGNVVEHANDGLLLYYSNGNVIAANIVTDCMVGCNVTYSPDNTFSGNSIQNNSYGMKLFLSSNNTIEHNVILGNTEIGLSVTDGSNENRIQNNDFVGNTRNAVFMNSVQNHWSHNYWDDWNGNGVYIIKGVLYIWGGRFSIPWVNVDVSPKEQPSFHI